LFAQREKIKLPFLTLAQLPAIKQRKKVWLFKLFGESAYCLSEKKQKEKFKYIIIF